MKRSGLMTARAAVVTAMLMAALGAGSCAKGDRCFVQDIHYARMKRLFLETGSYQRVHDAMKDEEWPLCERNEFQYRLRKELYLNEEDFALVPVGKEPDLSDLPTVHGDDGHSHVKPPQKDKQGRTKLF